MKPVSPPGVWVRRIQALALLTAVIALLILGLGIEWILLHSIGYAPTPAPLPSNTVARPDFVLELVIALSADIGGLIAVGKMLTGMKVND